MKKKILLLFLIVLALLIISNITYANEGFRIKNQQSVLNPVVYGHPWEVPPCSAPARGTEPWVAPPDQNVKLDFWSKMKLTLLARGFLFLNGIYIWNLDETAVKDMVIIH